MKDSLVQSLLWLLKTTFPGRSITQTGSSYKVNVPEFTRAQFRQLDSSPDITDIRVKRSGAGITIEIM